MTFSITRLTDIVHCAAFADRYPDLHRLADASLRTRLRHIMRSPSSLTYRMCPLGTLWTWQRWMAAAVPKVLRIARESALRRRRISRETTNRKKTDIAL